MTRSEHLQWAKDRALAYLGPKPSPTQTLIAAYGGLPPVERVYSDGFGRTRTERVHYVQDDDGTVQYHDADGRDVPGARHAVDLNGAYMSFVSDMGKHDETRNHPALALGHQMYFGKMLGTESQMRHWIEGFN